jgi:hypothetical protein
LFLPEIADSAIFCAEYDCATFFDFVAQVLQESAKEHDTRAQGTRSSNSLIAAARVARWFIFVPKIPTWVNFGELWNIKFW